MTRGAEFECGSVKVRCLIQVRNGTLLQEPGSETGSKVVKRKCSIRMIKGAECKCSPMEVNGLIKVRHGAPPHKPDLQAVGKVVKR
jgi:hypothetical protein